jgi:uncharacterized protein (TIGR02996 family)
VDDRDAFLRVIRADPTTDGPRLVYADWLDEHGEPARAELIRVQCALAAVSRGHATYAALLHRESELLATPGVADLLPAEAGVVAWRRGLVDCVRCTCRSWLEYGPAIVRAYPVTDVLLTDKRPQRREGGVLAWLDEDLSPTTRYAPNALPAALFDALPPTVPNPWEHVYTSGSDAVAALSAACLAWAERAPVTGLRPRPRPSPNAAGPAAHASAIVRESGDGRPRHGRRSGSGDMRPQTPVEERPRSLLDGPVVLAALYLAMIGARGVHYRPCQTPPPVVALPPVSLPVPPLPPVDLSEVWGAKSPPQ